MISSFSTCYKILGKNCRLSTRSCHKSTKFSIVKKLKKILVKPAFFDRFWSVGISSAGCQKVLLNRLSTISIMGNYHCHRKKVKSFSIFTSWSGVKTKITKFVLKTGFSRQKMCPRTLPCETQLLSYQPLLS